MNRDAIERLALERAVTVSAVLEVQLEKNPKLQPMAAILGLAKEQAAIAMRGLVFADPSEVEKVRAFQHEVRRYDDLVEWAKKIVVDGKEADRRLAEIDRQELEQLVTNPDVQAERDQLRGERTQED